MSTVDVRAIPLRACATWCEEGTGHADQHPADRSCWSEFHRVTTSSHKPVSMGRGEWVSDWVDVFLRRRPGAEEATLSIFRQGDEVEIMLTLEEAQQLVTVLQGGIDEALGR